MAGPKPFRKERVQRQLVRELSRLVLSDLKDPRMGFVTITRATVTADFHDAKIYFSVMGGEKPWRRTMQALRHAHGFIQRELARRIPMRTFPKVSFHRDESIEKSAEMVKLIDDLTVERRERGMEGSEEE